MPEICEVTITSQYLLTKLKNRYITNIKVVAGKYTHQTLVGKELIKKYKPLKITDVDSKGKFMWITMKSPDGKKVYMMNNFGLTGEWSFKDDTNDRVLFTVESHPNDIKKNKKYTLHYTDPRNFGIIQITDNEQTFRKKIDKLAPDLLKSNFSDEEFLDWVNNYLNVSAKRKNVPIVKVLLKQDAKDGILSGIGNYLSSEILYRAKISPHRPIGDLSKTELLKLAETIRYVGKQCYVANITGYMKKLADFIPKHKEKIKKGLLPDYYPSIKPNEDFAFLVYGRKVDDKGNVVKTDNIEGQRTTYWVPAVQI